MNAHILKPRRASYHLPSTVDGNDGNVGENGSSDGKSVIEQELQTLQQQYDYIEALEERNKAQLESFVDEQDQWESMEAEERELLSSKPEVEKRMDQLATELLQLW
eukprot:CAMPEP_0172454870 /NCGR_PEP_ID=MMETSP1065-20121228/11731_1 /TAXON_ID=265537 /ORGANISM="Amphiprora paludosa, Strain CCMP125" /LENGTH=105 /DNA_ID=CAMNT_0013207275 /DNA_START=287 /DNA_END=601 /DNA_ORIENTATION=-